MKCTTFRPSSPSLGHVLVSHVLIQVLDNLGVAGGQGAHAPKYVNVLQQPYLES